MQALKIIRPLNLLIIVLVLAIIKYGFFERLKVATTLDTLSFALLTIAILCIAAGGYIINDIYDVETDKINKPQRLIINKYISEKNADYSYLLCTSTGVALGFFISNLIDHKALAVIFVIVAALLYGYATSFKSLFFIGNILIAILVGLTPLLLVLFDIFPTIDGAIPETTLAASKTVFHVAIFAFGINLIRELIKDIQDTNGDKNAGRNTIPIVLGKRRSINIAIAFTLILIAATVFYLYNYMYNSKPLMLYFLAAVIGPLLYIIVKIFNAETPQDFKHISTILKVVMGTGICTLMFIPTL